MEQNAKTGALEPLDFEHLVECVPEFNQVSAKVDVYQFEKPIDSSDMQPALWAKLAGIIAERYELYDGFVILHGTDTMAYTASALSFMLENLTKPVVLTGSQLPIGQLRTDGKENLVTAIEVASAYRKISENSDNSERPIVPEVCIYFSGKLLRGNRATKINAEGFAAFDSFNYPHLGDAGINIRYNDSYIRQPDYTKPLIPHTKLNQSVVVFSLFPGVQEDIVSHVIDVPQLRSMIIRTYGSGNAPGQPWLLSLLKRAADRGMNVINVSQCLAGTVEMERYGTGYHLSEAGVVSGYDTTVEAAVTKLMVLQGEYDDNNIVREHLQKNLAGEISL